MRKDNKILMLKKPRRNWYAAPGGKMEQGESIKQSVIREYEEETGFTLKDPKLKGVFTILISENNEIVNEWMMFTFFCEHFEGEQLEVSKEGDLEWIPIDEVLTKPMAEGDRFIIQHAMHEDEILYATFTYTSDHTLLTYELDPQFT